MAVSQRLSAYKAYSLLPGSLQTGLLTPALENPLSSALVSVVVG